MSDENTTPAEEKQPVFSDISGGLYSQDDARQDLLATIGRMPSDANGNPVGIKFNGDWPYKALQDDGSVVFQPNTATLVVPISESQDFPDGRKRVPQVTLVLNVPTLSAIQNTENGLSWIEDAVVARLNTKARTAHNGGNPLPESVEDFLKEGERGRKDQGLKAFNNLAPQAITALGKVGIKVDKTNLQNILANQTVASALFPRIAKEFWADRVLHIMILEAQKAKYNTALLEHWKETRDEVTGSEQEFDLSAFVLSEDEAA